MPSTTSAVGPLTLPIAAGSSNQKLADPAIDGLLDFLAFTVKNNFDARLANLIGTSADACPTANRFTFNPTDPRGHRVRLPVPALFVWWDGRSTVTAQTSIYNVRNRELHVMYVFPELPALTTMNLRAGLLADVDAAFHKASERQQHPSYAYPGSPAGMPLYQSLAPLGVFGWKYRGGAPGRFGIDGGKDGSDTDKSGRDYPALRGIIDVQERIEQDTMIDPDDVLGDLLLTINGSDGTTTETAEIMQRYMTNPDGSEEP